MLLENEPAGSTVQSTVQCTVHLKSLLIDYLMADFKHSQIRQLGTEIESISLLCLNAHCRVKFMCADLRFGFLRLSTIKKSPNMLRSDHRELRNNQVKLGWWEVGGVESKDQY